MRWRGSGRGKRGGIRVIYCWMQSRARIYLLLAYAKNEQEDLSVEQIRVLQSLIGE